MASEKPICAEATNFCKVHLGKDCFAPFYGSVSSIFGYFVHLGSAWCYTDDRERPHIEQAMRSTLLAVEDKFYPAFLTGLIAASDWKMAHDLWRRIAPVDFRDITIAPKGALKEFE